jgi:hypothetical protein
MHILIFNFLRCCRKEICEHWFLLVLSFFCLIFMFCILILFWSFDLVLALTAIHVNWNMTRCFLQCSAFWNNNILSSIKPQVYFATMYLDCELFLFSFIFCLVDLLLWSMFGFLIWILTAQKFTWTILFFSGLWILYISLYQFQHPRFSIPLWKLRERLSQTLPFYLSEITCHF